MKKTLLTLLAAALLCRPIATFATTETPAEAQRTDVAAATPEEDTDPEFKTELAKLLKASGALSSMEAMLPHLRQMMEGIIQRSSAPTKETEKLIDAFFKDFSSDLQKLIYPIYQKYYTTDDLKQLNAFYDSPVGKKFAATTPQTTIEVQKAAAQYGQEKMMRLMQELKIETNQKQ